MNYRKEVDPGIRLIAKKHPYNSKLFKPVNTFLKRIEKHAPLEEGLACRQFVIKGSKDLDLELKVYEPENCEDMLPGLLYIHGGAFSYQATLHHIKLVMEYSKKAGYRVVLPDYHLVPEYKYPTAFEDVMAAYEYICGHLEELRIDGNRIGIAGDSAGGMLSAMVCNNCVEKNLPMPKLQMLIYPLTGVNLKTDSMKKYIDTPIWRAPYNEKMWKMYFGGDDYDYTNSPMHREVAVNSPKTYIETAQYDCIHDEGVLYAEKLKRAGVKVILNETQGTIHGYDSAWFSDIAKENIERRVEFLKQI